MFSLNAKIQKLKMGKDVKNCLAKYGVFIFLLSALNANGNLLKYVDRDCGSWVCRTVDGIEEVFHHRDIISHAQARSAYGRSAYVLQDGQQFNGYLFYNGSSPCVTDASGNKINQTIPIRGSTYDIFPGSANRVGVDPDSLHKNLMGTSYTGGKNPRGYNGAENYDYIPRNKSELASITHDESYGAKQALGVFCATLVKDTMIDDFRFVRANLCNMFSPWTASLKDRARSLCGVFFFGVFVPIKLFGSASINPNPTPTH